MGFADAFDSSLLDYSSDFEKQDDIYKKKLDIEEWMHKFTSQFNQSFTYTPKSPVIYLINDDLTIDVTSNCYIYNWIEDSLPDYIQFNIANQDFGIANGYFKTLKGSPRIVYGTFACHNNENLKTLIGGPETVYKEYYCSNKWLKSLEGAPKIVGEIFNMANCPRLKSLDYLPQAKGYRWYTDYFQDSSDLIAAFEKLNNK